jgi:hypothetical protein
MAVETTITQAIIAYLNALDGCICEKVMGGSTSSGRSDINGCYRGRSFRIEVKTPDNRYKPSKRQIYNLKLWYNSGAVTMVTYSLKFVKEVFDNPSFWAYSEYEAYVQAKEKNNCVSWASAGALKRKDGYTYEEE